MTDSLSLQQRQFLAFVIVGYGSESRAKTPTVDFAGVRRFGPVAGLTTVLRS